MIYIPLYIFGIFEIYILVGVLWIHLVQKVEGLRTKSWLRQELRDVELHIYIAELYIPMYFVLDRSFKPWLKQRRELREKHARLKERIEAFESS